MLVKIRKDRVHYRRFEEICDRGRSSDLDVFTVISNSAKTVVVKQRRGVGFGECVESLNVSIGASTDERQNRPRKRLAELRLFDEVRKTGSHRRKVFRYN